MASLVAPLASGLRGAESGSVEFYVRGTNTRASVYSDKEGVTAVTSHVLDSNGALVRYVGEAVDVVVRDSTGALLSSRNFTWEDYAASVALNNVGFTGSFPDGSTGPGGRTTVDAALYSLYASLGAVDGKVLIGSAGQNLSTAIAGTTGVFFNVKSTAYGALGNGTTDDTNAIQTAINACITAGGGIVYFPPGTYLITAALAMTSAKVLLLGATAGGTIIKQNTDAVSGWITFTAAGAISGIGFDRATTAMTGDIIKTTTTTGIRLHDCTFAGFNGTAISVTTGGVSAFGCTFAITETSGRFCSASTGSVRFSGCTFNVSSASTADLFKCTNVAGRVIVEGANYTQTAVVATPIFGSSGGMSVTGGSFVFAHTSGTVVFCGGSATACIAGVNFYNASSGGTLSLASGLKAEAASQFRGSMTYTFFVGAGASQTRDSRTKVTTGAGTSYAADPSFRYHEISQSSGASFVFSNPTLAPGASGQTGKLTFLYKNGSGSNFAPTFGTAFKGPTLPTVNNGQSLTFECVLSDSASGIAADKWVIIGGTPAAFTS